MNAEFAEIDGRVFLEKPIAGLVIPPDAVPPAPRSNGQGCRVIRTARAKDNTFAITVSHRTIGVVPVDLERGVRRRAGERESVNPPEEYRGR
jgi:hypothetical protein